ncbi:unnamed protein product, partial [Amoebophrya sp. A25]
GKAGRKKGCGKREKQQELLTKVFPLLLDNSVMPQQSTRKGVAAKVALPKLPALLAVALFDDVPYCRQLALNVAMQLLTLCCYRFP